MMSQEEPLAGKTAWVTGSGRGIGRAYAERLLKLGARVAIHDLSEEAPSQFEESKSLSEVAEELGGLGDVVAVSGDLTEENQVRRMATGHDGQWLWPNHQHRIQRGLPWLRMGLDVRSGQSGRESLHPLSGRAGQVVRSDRELHRAGEHADR